MLNTRPHHFKKDTASKSKHCQEAQEEKTIGTSTRKSAVTSVGTNRKEGDIFRSRL
jgi:hypothetical protein